VGPYTKGEQHKHKDLPKNYPGTPCAVGKLPVPYMKTPVRPLMAPFPRQIKSLKVQFKRQIAHFITLKPFPAVLTNVLNPRCGFFAPSAKAAQKPNPVKEQNPYAGIAQVIIIFFRVPVSYGMNSS